MRQTAATQRPTRGALSGGAVGLLVVTAAIIGTLAYQSAPSAAPSFIESVKGDHAGATTQEGGAVTEDDGALPDGVTVFDDEYPGIAKLDPDVLGAMRRAATDAANDGVEIVVDSGWRSPRYQEQLLLQAIATYGSREEATRWVATPGTSAHAAGEAIDIGHAEARAWLSRHGAEYGLCQTYRNEPWHYELRPQAIEHGCPRMYADPTHDPRMRS